MVAKRRQARVRKQNLAARKKNTSPAREKGPGYMVQLTEPNLLRRDLLETLREVILFMQSYEKFKRIQQEKVQMFSQLKYDLKELNTLLKTKMKAHFPKGKLDAITEAQENQYMEKEHELDEREIALDSVKMAPVPRRSRVAAPVAVVEKPKNELDQLEDQLRDIEAQLKGIQ